MDLNTLYHRSVECWATHGRSHAARTDALRRVSTAHVAPEPPLAHLASGWLADPLLAPLASWG